MADSFGIKWCLKAKIISKNVDYMVMELSDKRQFTLPSAHGIEIGHEGYGYYLTGPTMSMWYFFRVSSEEDSTE